MSTRPAGAGVEVLVPGTGGLVIGAAVEVLVLVADVLVAGVGGDELGVFVVGAAEVAAELGVDAVGGELVPAPHALAVTISAAVASSSAPLMANSCGYQASSP